MKSNAGIYYIKNETKNIYYIGSSKDIESRLYQHFTALKSGKHYNNNLQKDFSSGDIFTHGIIKSAPNASKHLLCELEQDVINNFNGVKLYNRVPAQRGYISKDFLCELMADVYCKEHFNKTFRQFTATMSPAKVSMYYEIISNPENKERIEQDYQDLIDYQNKKIFHERRRRPI